MQPPEYQRVVFHHPEIPMFLAHETPSDTVNRLAKEKFGLDHGDFDKSFKAHMPGKDSKGYVFEVQVKFHPAQELRSHPDVMLVIDTPPPREGHFGARDPKELKRHPKPPKP